MATGQGADPERDVVDELMNRLWTPLRLRCGSEVFTTTRETLQRAPGNALLRYVDEDSAAADPVSGVVIIPPEVCCDAEAFSYVLDALRSGGEWMPIAGIFPQQLHTRVIQCLTDLGIGIEPPQLPAMAPGLGKQPISYDYCEVMLPLTPPASSDGDSYVRGNACEMIAGLALRGFAVVGEYAPPAGVPSGERPHRSRSYDPYTAVVEGSSARAQSMPANELAKAADVLGHASSMLLLERCVTEAPLVHLLAEQSAWLRALTQAL